MCLVGKGLWKESPMKRITLLLIYAEFGCRVECNKHVDKWSRVGTRTEPPHTAKHEVEDDCFDLLSKLVIEEDEVSTSA